METQTLTDRQRTIADFRFAVIADLVFTHATGQSLAKQIAAKAAMVWQLPHSSKASLTTSCIRKWLAVYRSDGRDGLVPKIRKDAGKSKVMTDADKELLLALLEQKPGLCASVAVKLLQREGKLIKNISKSSLSRFIRASGFSRQERSACRSKDQVQPFAFSQPLECVQVDAMHSFAVPGPDGKLHKAILVAFLDDATRRVVYARFCFSENALEFERGIYHILLSHGRIRRIYTDNGATFVAEQTKIILSSLGIQLMHSRPGIPKGRGKIERFFRTVRTQFEATLTPESIVSIHDYNQRFLSWLEREYHRTGHSGLNGQTPLEAWLAGSRFIFKMEATINLDEAFCHQFTRTVSGDGTISLEGKHFEVPSVLCGLKVLIKTNPLAPVPQVRVSHNGKDYGSARPVDRHANAYSRRIMDTSDPAQAALRSSSSLGGNRE